MKRYKYTYLVFLLILLFCSESVHALDLPENALITDASLFSSYGASDECSYESLLDNDPDTRFFSDTTKNEKKHYLAVDFPHGIHLEDDENLYVVMTRPNRVDSNIPTSWNPTAMEIHYSLSEDVNGDYVMIDNTEAILARVYFINRGSGTTELSEALSKSKLEEVIKKQTGEDSGLEKIKRLKFVITMNNGRVLLYRTTIRPMIFGGFQLYRAKPGEIVVGKWIDRFHLKTDVHYDYENYEFTNTLGVLDERNRHTRGDGGTLEELGGWERLYDPVTGQRTEKALSFFEKSGLEIDDVMPDFRWVTRYNDPLVPFKISEDAENNEKYESVAVRDRDAIPLQPTATIEHLLYAIQGEPIALYPFYTLPGTPNYSENFIHWYNYVDGKHVKDGAGNELLGFVGDPSDVYHSKNYGWYTSPLFKSGEKVNLMTINNEEDYLKFIKNVNDGNTTLSAILECDLNFDGMTVPQIGSKSNPWRGAFMGNNYKIENLKISSTNEGVGMFAATGDGATIANIFLDESCVFEGKHGGSDNSGTGVGVVGLHVNGSLNFKGVINRAKITGKRNAGGFVGTVESGCKTISIENCIFNGVLSGPNGSEDNSQNGYVIGWMRGVCNVNLKNVFIDCNESSNFAEYQICRHNTDWYEKSIAFENCYSFQTISQNGKKSFIEIDKTDFSGQDYIELFGNEWTISGIDGTPLPPFWTIEISHVSDIHPDRKFGTYATFFYPRDPFSGSKVTGADNMRPLEKNEYVIAADMAQHFSMQYNVVDPDDSNGTSGQIIEPVIKYRHVFRVRDGYEFANTYMADKKGNDLFIKENRRHISATAGKDFQIRLDHPYPVEKTTRGVFYYKIDDTDYRRICSRIIQVKDEKGIVLQRRKVCQMFVMDDKGQLVYDKDGSPMFNPSGKWVKVNGEIIEDESNTKDMIGSDILFYPTAVFDGQGSRNVDGTNYYICGGGGHFFRMLCCDANTASLRDGKQRTYTVQVIGTDYDNKVIHLADSPNDELMVQEFVVTFLPQEVSMMVTETELASLITNRQDIADIVNDVRECEDKINFDDYAKFESIDFESEFKVSDFIVHYPHDRVPVEDGQDIPSDTKAYNYFRWPLPWSSSNYGYGYNTRGDYAMQMIVDNQAVTSHHSYGTLQDSSLPHKDGLKENQMVNNYGEGPGLFDRLFYTSRKTGDKDTYKRGYFFYVNAADDPGIIARLHASELCPGAKITVTCWIAEFTSNMESANVSFNFVARLKNGKRVPMHAHVTGYVGQDNPSSNPYRNQWLFVYSSFVPLLTDKDISASEIDHYEIEIDNNAKSSQGADYAIDDIRVYVDRPVIEASQLNPICSKDEVDIRISSDFGQLLENLTIQEPQVESLGQDVDLYYAIFDRKKFEECVNSTMTDDEIFKESVIRIATDDENYDDYTSYGCMKFNTYLGANEEYMPDSENFVLGKAYRWIENGVNKIVFNINPAKRQMIPGREYIFSILTETHEEENSSDPSAADWIYNGVTNSCAKKCYLVLEGSSVIKIDGEVQQPVNEIDACRNQSPVVQIDLYAQEVDDNGNPILDENDKPVMTMVDRNALFDWFDGTMEDFLEIEENGVSLYEAIGKFRDEYPDYDRVSSAEVTHSFSQEMKDIIEKYSHIDPTGDKKSKLILSQSSYVFPPLVLPSGTKSIDKSIVAIPIPVEVSKNQLLCTQPTEINVTVRQKAPFMAHGFKNIKYPDALTDVALRLSIDRLNMAYKNDEKSLEGKTPIVLPYRSVVPATDKVKRMQKSCAGYDFAPVFLAATNDPEYKDLFPSDIYDENIESIYNKGEGDLWLVGEVIGLEASVGHEDEGYVKVEFADNIKFKEGFWYTFRYLFEEENVIGISNCELVQSYSEDNEIDSNSEDEDAEEFVCTGHVLFTLKVVPKYQKWNGLASDFSGENFNFNWNNDDNWNRVGMSEIMFENESETRKTEFCDYLTDVKNNNGKTYNSQKFSYAPLYFTNTIIPRGCIVPKMFNILENQYEEIEYGNFTFRWDKNPSGLSFVDEYIDNENDLDYTCRYNPDLNGGVGSATSLVEYDMIERIENDGTYCRPWVANKCNEIHFEAGSEIGCQNYLSYNKAWVDMEVEPGRWYTLSSPLQGVVAGDMYLPSKTARQNTPYFDPILFNTDSYNRFVPAVFQRSWNTASALVYNFDSQDNPTNVMVETNWSNVYNDVRVKYEAGHGFSIKTDLYKMNSEDRPSSVIFRLPKADTAFDYYTENGEVGNINTKVERYNTYKLNPMEGSMTIEASTSDNTLFLVGNPFMAHLDMTKFLKKNEGIIKPKYWILDGSRQGAVIMKEDGELLSTLENPRYLAPMQGFFVEAINKSNKITLSYDYSMAITVNDIDKSEDMDILVRSSSIMSDVLKIHAMDSGSAALVVFDSNSDFAYNIDEDVIFVEDASLDASALVYTVAHGTATTINVMPEIKPTEVCLIAAKEKVTNLLFEGVDESMGLMLYNTLDDSYTKIYDGMQYEVEGSTSGNLFIVDTPKEIDVSEIKITAYGKHVRVNSPVGGLIVKVYDTSGRMLYINQDGLLETEFMLSSGIYIIDAVDKNSTKSMKLYVR